MGHNIDCSCSIDDWLFSGSCIHPKIIKMSRRSVISLILIPIGVAIFGYTIYVTYEESKRNNKIEAEIEELKMEAGMIRGENSELEEKISYFETEEFQERIAKEKLNLQKSDENVVIIKTMPSTNEEDGEIKEGEEIKNHGITPNHKKWWDYFF